VTVAGRWAVYESGGTGVVEVMPIDDVIGHEDGDDCPCLPVVEYVNGGWMHSHNAWDGRE
jgi:hypothetical protein